MKKSVAILGSTGSIGKSLLNIIKKNKKNFKIVLLTANNNYKDLYKQALEFNVQNVVVNNKASFEKLKKLNKKKKIKVHNNFKNLEKLIKSRIDYTMSAIVGIDGLEPTINVIRYTKIIAIANKESIICGWSLIKENLKKYKTNFIPVDSEHFSLWFGLMDKNKNDIEKVFLTASGGPFLKKSKNYLQNISVKKALNHPNWKMGNKISIDSATMINKVFEVVEAKNIFDIHYKKIKILIHPKSYIHALIKFNSGMIKIIAHETSMKIPIFNSLFHNENKILNSKKIDISLLNNINFEYPNLKQYPMLKILKLLPIKNSLFETVMVSANDTFVNLFLDKKITFIDIQKELFKILNNNEFLKLRKKQPNKVGDIIKLNNYVRSKILKRVYKSKNVKKSN